jgi:regulator-associated protein of mTOR
LNVGVDPPDVVKPVPCAKTECWVDPFSMPPYKAMEAIATNLQKQYEKYHPRARYKQAFDPKFEEVKKLCTSLRRSAKEDRVLFHYNGHGVPKPTANGEIWVFNRDYTQYLPLSVYDLQTWMGANSVYVYDCSAAGEIIKNFNDFARRRGKEVELAMTTDPTMLNGYTVNPSPDFVSCIQFAACAGDQTLPINPELPADLFTCCLTAPIKMSLKYYMLQQGNRLLPHVTPDMIDRIPGLVTDRRTMLGELNWILTAIMDSIAWDILPMATFQRLFRQDLLVSLLSRHFILAQRVMRSYDCTPQSWPEIPSAHNHPLWRTWDFAVDQCLAQLPTLLANSGTSAPISYSPSTFFTDQLKAFEVWLLYGARIQCDMNPRVQQLPVVLQVLLSNVHRLRALELFSRFLSLGDWAVRMALAVGIFPYILKLLQSPDRELRPLLVCMWSKIFALDPSAQADLLVDNGYLYFVLVLSDTNLDSEFRINAAFVLANFVRNFARGQDLAHQNNLIATCLEQLNDPNPLLRQWLCICLGLIWNNHRNARWCGVRDSAHEKLFDLLYDPAPDVRASAVFALGTFINAEKTDHANTIDHSIGMKLINSVGNDGSPLVRKELIQALQWLVLLFENQFVGAEVQCRDEEEKRKHSNKDDGSHFSPTGKPFIGNQRV